MRGPAIFNADGGEERTESDATESGGKDKFDFAAEVYLRGGYGPMMLVFSEKIKPDEAEHSALVQSLAALLRAKQSEDLSPGWAFAIVAAGVFAKKCDEPSVRERVAKHIERIKNLFRRRSA